MSDWKTSNTLLMQVSHQDSEEAWQQFCQTYSPFIYSLVQKFDLAHEDCEDLTQDILIKVWKALGKFLYEPSRCRFRTWLARVCKNTVLNYLDLKRNKSRRLQLDDSSESLLKLSVESDVEKQEEAEWKMFLANKAWQNISKKFTELQLDCYSLMLGGKSANEAAELCGLKENTVFVYRKKVQLAMSEEILRLSHELDG